MTATSCEEVVVTLSEPGALDQPAIRAHLESCAGCRQTATTIAALVHTARSASAHALANLPARVLAARARTLERSSRRLSWRTGVLGGLSAAGAAAAVALVLHFASPSQPVPSVPPQIAAAAGSAQTAADEDLLDFDEDARGLSDDALVDLVAFADDDLDDDLDLGT